MVEEIVKLIEEQKLNDLRKYLESINSADFPSFCSILSNMTSNTPILPHRLPNYLSRI